jgi:hypothetical protein
MCNLVTNSKERTEIMGVWEQSAKYNIWANERRVKKLHNENVDPFTNCYYGKQINRCEMGKAHVMHHEYKIRTKF